MITVKKHIFKTLVLVSSLVFVISCNEISGRTYIVTFNTNGGYGTVPNPQTVQAGLSILLPSGNSLSRNNFEFGGWNTDSNGKGINYSGGTYFTPTGHITLYANWERLFTVTFDANGGTGQVPSPQTVREGSSITLPRGNTLSRNGFDFVGWNTNASGSGTNYKPGSSFTPIDNVTLYAEWERLIEVPNNISATATSSSTIRISWSAVTDATDYYVYRSLSASGFYSIVGSTANTSYTDTGLSPGTTYYYKVSAISRTYKESPLSSYAFATTSSR